MEDNGVKDGEFSKALENVLGGGAQMAAQDLCSIYGRVPPRLKEQFGQLVEKYIGASGTRFYELLLSIAEEHCGTH